jgi:acetolactate synthase-1/2/3 large subunit
MDIVTMIKPVCKYAVNVTTHDDMRHELKRAVEEAYSGRMGPVLVDIPMNLQNSEMEHSELLLPDSSKWGAVDTGISPEQVGKLIQQFLGSAQRPLIMFGAGVGLAGQHQELERWLSSNKIPFVATWAALNYFNHEAPNYIGHFGVYGNRGGNAAIQNADKILVLGSRLNIRQVSYNWPSFARNAKKIWVDIDPAEFNKPYVKADVLVHADLKDFVPSLTRRALTVNWQAKHQAWVNWCADINIRFTPKSADYPVSEKAINSYHLIEELFTHLRANDIVVCGDATATIVPFQIGKIKAGMRLFSNSGSASMGYDIPAALGAAIANPKARVICLAGDGSSMMNIQELETISNLNLNVIVFILNNDGYLSIKQTQRNFFKREAGSSSTSGLSFPDFKKLGEVFGFRSIDLKKANWQVELRVFMQEPGPSLCNADLDVHQEFEPRLKSKMVDGVITTPELDDMHPFMDAEQLTQIRNSAKAIN